MTSCYNQRMSLSSLQGRCSSVWLDPALRALPNSFQVSEALCTMRPAWADDAAWVPSKTIPMTKMIFREPRVWHILKFRTLLFRR